MGSKVALFVNEKKAFGSSVAEEMASYLKERQLEVSTHSSLTLENVPSLDEVFLAISLGGDGTVLASARFVAPFGIPILPVNLGNFGFITELGKHDWREELDRFLSGNGDLTYRLMLSVKVERAKQSVFDSNALNDIVISGAGISKLIQMEVNLSFASLGNYRADGIIVASPTGSTAYSAAAGGPILEPQMDAMILNPICPFTLSHRPIVLPSWERVRVRVSEAQRTDVLLTVDGQLSAALEPGDLITVEAAPYKAKIAFSNKRTFYDVLRTKLNWSGGPDA